MSREIAKIVESQFPEIYREQGSLLIDFLKGYYLSFCAPTPGGGVVVPNLDREFDLDEAVEPATLELERLSRLPGFPKETASSIRMVLKHAKDMFEAKCSPQGVDLLFRIAFGEGAEINDLSRKVMRLNEADWARSEYIEVRPDDLDVLFALNKRNVVGSVSGAKAYAESIISRTVYGKIVYVIYISGISPGGRFVYGEKILDEATMSHDRAPEVVGSMNDIEVVNGGTGFSVGDIFDVIGEFGQRASARATETVSAQGTLEFGIADGGFGFSTDNSVTTVGISAQVLRTAEPAHYHSSNNVAITESLDIPLGYMAVQRIERVVVANANDLLNAARGTAVAAAGGFSGVFVSASRTGTTNDGTVLIAPGRTSGRLGTSVSSVSSGGSSYAVSSVSRADAEGRIHGKSGFDVNDQRNRNVEGQQVFGLTGATGEFHSGASIRVEWELSPDLVLPADPSATDHDYIRDSVDIYSFAEIIDVHSGMDADFEIGGIDREMEAEIYTTGFLSENNNHTVKVSDLVLSGRNSGDYGSVAEIHVEYADGKPLGHWRTRGVYIDMDDLAEELGYSGTSFSYTNGSHTAGLVYGYAPSDMASSNTGEALFCFHDDGTPQIVVHKTDAMGVNRGDGTAEYGYISLRNLGTASSDSATFKVGSSYIDDDGNDREDDYVVETTPSDSGDLRTANLSASSARFKGGDGRLYTFMLRPDYSGNTAISFSGGTPTTPATATVSIASGRLGSVAVAGGAGYGSAPTADLTVDDGPAVSELVVCMDYGLEAGSLTTTVGDLLESSTQTVGRITRLDSVVPGSNYSTRPFVTITTPNMVDLDQELRSNPDGENAVISVDTKVGQGIVSKFSLLDSGFGFGRGEELLIEPKVEREDGVVIAGRAVVGHHGRGGGHWRRQSAAANVQRIADNDVYQEFSHELVSKVPYAKYKPLLDTLIHTAGYRHLPVLAVESVSEEPEIETTVELTSLT